MVQPINGYNHWVYNQYNQLVPISQYSGYNQMYGSNQGQLVPAGQYGAWYDYDQPSDRRYEYEHNYEVDDRRDDGYRKQNDRRYSGGGNYGRNDRYSRNRHNDNSYNSEHADRTDPTDPTPLFFLPPCPPPGSRPSSILAAANNRHRRKESTALVVAPQKTPSEVRLPLVNVSAVPASRVAVPPALDLSGRTAAMQDALSRLESRLATFGSTSRRQLQHMASKQKWQASTA